jgi:xylan 1,4-beta-xylosidase
LPLQQGQARLTHFRIDAEHSNAHTAWLRMGSPQTPTAAQRAELVQAGELQAMATPAHAAVVESRGTITFSLPRQAVSLLVLEM